MDCRATVLHSAALQPVSQPTKFGGEALKPAHGCGSQSGRTRHIVGTIVHIDSRGVWMDYLQARVFRLQPPSQFLPCFAIPPQLFVRLHPSSPWWNRDSVRPGDQSSHRQYRGHAYRRARSSISHFGLSLPNRILDQILQKSRTLDKFLTLARCQRHG